MPLRTPCPHCGIPNIHEDFEYGLEKYCVSCQRLFTIPPTPGEAAVPSASTESVKPIPPVEAIPTPAKPTVRVTSTPAPAKSSQRPEVAKPRQTPKPAAEEAVRRPNTRVFGVLDTESLVLGNVICPCDPTKPVEIPYRASDVAIGSVYCPRCSRAVSVAQGLEKANELSPSLATENVGITPTRERGVTGYITGFLAVMVVVTAVGLGVVWAWRETPEVSAMLDRIGLSEVPFLGSSLRGKPPEPKIIPLTLEQTYRIAILQAAAPTGALPALSALHPGLFVKGKAPVENPITLARIEGLKRQTDLQEALIMAQVWKQMLADQKTNPMDPRFSALDQMIQTLQNRLHPPEVAAPPTAVARFRDLLGILRGAISEKKLPEGLKAVAEADGLLEKHPRDLTPFSQSYYVLKRRFTEIDREINGVVRLDKLLDESAKFLRAEASTEAIENIAKVKFLASRTPMNKETGDRLDKKVRSLTDDLLFVRGKRSVVELRKCLTEGDQATRDLLVADANTHLPGLLESKIKDLAQEMNTAAKADISQASGSAFGKTVAFRLHYEKALDAFGADDAPTMFAQAALAAKQDAGIGFAKLEALVFEYLDQIGSDAFLMGDDAPDFAERLAKLKNLLNLADTWKDSSRWSKLDTTLTQRGERFAKSAVSKATELASKDRLQEAREALKPALVLGEASAIKSAKDLDQRWAQELKVRADQAAEEGQWKRIEGLRQEKKALDALAELGRFTLRYPKSTRQKEIAELERELQLSANPAILEKFRELESHREKKNWSEYHRAYQFLSKLLLPEAEKAKLEKHRRTIEDAQQEARGKFFQLSTRHRAMITQDQVRALLVDLPSIVAILPDLAEAETLLTEAKEKGHKYAEKLLPTVASLVRSSPRLAEERVRLIEILDSNGPLAVEARKTLKKR